MKRTLAIVLSMLLVLPCIASFTVFADVWAGEKIRVDGTNNGVWQGNAGRTEYYDVNYAIDDTNLYIEVDYYGSLNGTASSYGNGNGTMIRIWFHDEDKTYDGAKARSYTSFIDISYVDGAVWDRFLNNTVAEGNTASVVYAYNDGAARSYSINSTFGENTWVMKLTMPLALVGTNVQFQPTVSNNDGSEIGNDALYFGKNILFKGANGLAWYWDRGSALPAPEGTVAYFTETDVPDVGTHNNIAVGSDEYGTKVNTDSYYGKMADGVTPAAGYDTVNWRAFRGGENETSGVNGYQFVIIDLGEVRDDIGSVGTWYWSANKSGIVPPYELYFYGSINGSDWLYLGAPDLSDELHQTANDTAVWEYVTFDTTLAARYIMMKVYAGYSFSFFGEISVNVVEEPEFEILSSVGFVGGDVTILVPYTDDNGTYNTPMEISAQIGPNAGTGKDYNYYSLIVVGADGKVVSTHKTIGDTAHGDVEIPEGGYILAMNGVHEDIDNWNNAIYVGDTITLKGIDIADYAGVAATTIEGASFSSNHTHAYTETVYEPTCNEAGYTEITCSCGYSEVKEGSEVPATGEHDWEEFVKEANCKESGYTSDICSKCGTEVIREGSEVPASGAHAYTGVLQSNGFYQFTCSICNDSYVGYEDGTAVITLPVSHNNAYSWAAYDTMIISASGKTVKETCGYDCQWWVMYKVEYINGKYITTSYLQNSVDIGTSVPPENGFLWLVHGNDPEFTYATEGKLLNYEFVPSTDTLFFTTGAAETPLGYIYASPVAEADYTAYNAAVANANALDEKDYTPETWAVLAEALAVDVSGKFEYQQDVVDAATAAINNALLGLEDAEVTVMAGDMNNDGAIDAIDIVALAQTVSAGSSTDASDVNGDGSTDAIDIVALAQLVAAGA